MSAIFLGTARAISCLSIDSSGTEAEAFHAKRPTFQTILDQTAVRNATQTAGGVRVTGITEDSAPFVQLYTPGHPLANEQGYVWGSNINEVQEMIEMLDASRGHQKNVEVIKTAKDMRRPCRARLWHITDARKLH